MRNRMSEWTARAALSIALASVQAQSPAGAQDEPFRRGEAADVRPGDRLIGEWWTEGREGRIRFVRHRDGTYWGITTCCTPTRPTPDHPARDLHNPNPKMRGRSTVGIVLIWNLTYEAGRYVGGYVYNPRDGDTYRFQAEIVDEDTLKVRGYMAIPLLGESQVWKRYAAR